MSRILKSSSPLVSVVVPTYNRGAVIMRTLASLFEQTYRNTEIIVVDDGSTDDTAELLRPFEGRIVVIRQANAGPSAARNRGVAASRGEFVAFLDSDDLWHATKLERQVTLLSRFPEEVPCCVCNAIQDAEDRPRFYSFEEAVIFPPYEEGLWLNPSEVLATRFLFFNQAVLIRREAFLRVGGFDENLWLLEDWDLAMRLSLEGPWAFIREALAFWIAGASGSLSKRAQEDEVALRQAAIKVHQNALGRLARRRGHRRTESLLRLQLSRAERALSIAEMAQRKSFKTATLGRCLRVVERYRSAFFRLSPRFPQMRAEAVASICHGKQVARTEVFPHESLHYSGH